MHDEYTQIILKREIDILKVIKHPNVLRCFDIL